MCALDFQEHPNQLFASRQTSLCGQTHFLVDLAIYEPYTLVHLIIAIILFVKDTDV